VRAFASPASRARGVLVGLHRNRPISSRFIFRANAQGAPPGPGSFYHRAGGEAFSLYITPRVMAACAAPRIAVTFCLRCGS